MTFQSEKISKVVNADGLTMPTRIRKRSGSWEKFNPEKIYNAVQRCYDQTGKKPKVTAQELTERVVAGLASSKGTKNVEGIQDSIEFCLNTAGDFTHAREFILYREERTKSRSKTIPNAVIDAFAADKQFLPSPGQQFLFYDKYSKYNRDLDGGRRETWNETVDRVVDHLRWEVDQHVAAEAAKGNKVEGISDEVFAEIRDGILKTHVMPSMRLLAMAGPAVRRNSLALYNCSYLPVRDTQAFVEALLISMNGCGVGFSVERENVERFPRIKRQKKNQEVETHYVEDTTEGWAEAVRIGLETWWDGYDIKFDTSFVRPAGSILFTKGGRSSGPEPLEKMLRHLREIVLSRQGSFLRTSDAHLMMCHVGDAAVQGGTRRTAMISLFSQDDHDMLTIKSGPNMDPVLWNANNSAVWAEEQDDLTIMKQMVAMIEGKSGEPGIFSRTNAQNTKPAGRKKAEFGTNPCVTGDTWVTTANGPRQVQDLVGKRFNAIVNGRTFSSTDKGFFSTGTKRVYRLVTSDGRSVRLTGNHRIMTGNRGWVEAADLNRDDAIVLHDHSGLTWGGRGTQDEGYAIGHLVGDGTFDNKGSILSIYCDSEGNFPSGTKPVEKRLHNLIESLGHRSDWSGWIDPATNSNQKRLRSAAFTRLAESYGVVRGNKTMTDEIEMASSEFTIGFLRGLFDADGHVEGESTSSGVSIRLTSIDINLLERVQRALSRLGMSSTIRNSHAEGRVAFDNYSSKASYRLIISGSSAKVFMDRVGFEDTDKATKWTEATGHMVRGFYNTKKTVSLVSLEEDGTEEVFDCTVPGPHAFDANGYVAHNCGEIILRPYGLCNLSQAVSRFGDKEEDLARKIRLATIIGIIQSLSTRFPGMRDEWEKNTVEERLLGVDLTAQHTCEILRPGAEDGDKIRERMRDLTDEVAAEYAAKLNINVPAATTTNKPAGNSSELLDVTSGIHAAHAPFYIRRYTVGTHSPLFKVLKEAGAPMEPRFGSTPENATSWILSIPRKAAPGVATKKEMTALDQLGYWKLNKIHYTRHNPSVTISYYPDEILDIVSWVCKNKEIVGGLSFLPASDHVYAQAPYEEISEEKYNDLDAAFPDIKWEMIHVYEQEDMTTAAQELACFAGTCEV